jgi:hypothetical protein
LSNCRCRHLPGWAINCRGRFGKYLVDFRIKNLEFLPICVINSVFISALQQYGPTTQNAVYHDDPDECCGPSLALNAHNNTHFNGKTHSTPSAVSLMLSLTYSGCCLLKLSTAIHPHFGSCLSNATDAPNAPPLHFPPSTPRQSPPLPSQLPPLLSILAQSLTFNSPNRRRYLEKYWRLPKVSRVLGASSASTCRYDY